jgi:serine/threonine protein kinase
MTFTTALDEIYSEIEIMKLLDHDNIVKLHEVIDDPASDKLYLIIPLAEYGEIMSWNSKEDRFQINHKL